jgi:hypothetical protein
MTGRRATPHARADRDLLRLASLAERIAAAKAKMQARQNAKGSDR